MGDVTGEPVAKGVPAVGTSNHCSVPGPAAVAANCTVPVPQRVRFEEVGASGTFTTVTLTEEVLVHPERTSVTVTV
jgi:hypothetical protein